MPRFWSLVLLVAFASAARLEMNALQETGELAFNQDLHLSMGAHAQGLEAEHDFELITHDSSNSSGWDVTAQDETVIGKITGMLNPPGADSAWHWRNEAAGWTFGLVKLTAQTAKGSLALHMLHRHGFAPLLAGRAPVSFTKFFEARKRTRPSDMSDVEFLVSSQEEFDMVQTMKGMLESLTLSGLRNLHSYDHQWSVNRYAGKVSGCTRTNGGGCILQAGMSPSAYNFLTDNGFKYKGIQAAKAGGESVMRALSSGQSGLAESTYEQFLSPGHTGELRHDFRTYRNQQGGMVLKGNIVWEDGAMSKGVTLQLTSEQETAYLAAAGRRREALVDTWLEEHMEKLLNTHKSFMSTHRLKVWSNEQAEFVEMYPKYERAQNPRPWFDWR